MSMASCIFCDICSKTRPCDLLYEDSEIIVFKDIKPVSTFHYLAVPKQHIKDVNSLTTLHKELITKLVDVGKIVLEKNKSDTEDLRMGFHIPPFNSVQHLHLHLISPVSEMSFFHRLAFKPNTWWFSTVDYVLSHLKDPINY